MVETNKLSLEEFKDMLRGGFKETPFSDEDLKVFEDKANTIYSFRENGEVIAMLVLREYESSKCNNYQQFYGLERFISKQFLFISYFVSKVKGVGAKLLLEVMRLNENCNKTFLLTLELSNIGLLKYYEDLGFNPISKYKLDNGNDKFVEAFTLKMKD